MDVLLTSEFLRRVDEAAESAGTPVPADVGAAGFFFTRLEGFVDENFSPDYGLAVLAATWLRDGRRFGRTTRPGRMAAELTAHPPVDWSAPIRELILTASLLESVIECRGPRRAGEGEAASARNVVEAIRNAICELDSAETERLLEESRTAYRGEFRIA